MTRQTDDDALQPPAGPAAKAQPMSEVLTVAQEFATVGVERQDLGGVRVRIVTDEDTVLHPVETRSETVEVTRHPVGREVDRMPQPRTEGDVTIIPVVEERAVLVTRLFVTEEIHIRRTPSTRTVEVPVTLRHQRAMVERLDASGLSDPASADPAAAPPSTTNP